MQYHNASTTKKELAAALKQLMEQKPLEKISIREITSLCGLRRETFYYHFADIYALIQWMFEEEALALLRQHETPPGAQTAEGETPGMALHGGPAEAWQIFPADAYGILESRADAGEPGAENQTYGFVPVCKTALRAETALQRVNGKLDFWEILHQNAS